MIIHTRQISLNISIVVICIIVTQPVLSQEYHKKTLFETQLVDQKTQMPIVFANVLNPSRNWWAISDTSGRATLPVYPGDTLTITSLGYYLIHFIITDSVIRMPRPFIIKMQGKRFEIKRVNIFALGTYEDFKYRVLHMKMPDKLTGIKNFIRLDKDKLPSHPLQEQMAIPIFSPITAIYNIFSKDFKSIRKLGVAVKNEKLIRFANIKYNREIVERITGLKDMKLDEFILKYRPTIDYLVTASEYEVIGRIMSDFENYKIETDQSIKK